jgi:hypothetical protein
MEIDETVTKRRAKMDKRVVSILEMMKNSPLANPFTAYKVIRNAGSRHHRNVASRVTT